MSIFSRRKKPTYVKVDFRKVDDAHFPLSGGFYTYAWNLEGAPTVGTWVMVPTPTGLATAVITNTNTEPPPGVKISSISSLVDPREVRAAIERHSSRVARSEASMDIWLDMMRAKAGLPVDQVLPKSPPHGLPAIPPVRGQVVGQPAYDRGRVWMRAHHRAVELGRPDEECRLFELIAREWYARGRKKKAG